MSGFNSQAGLQSHIVTTPPRCTATYDDTNDGGLFHRCNRVAGHLGSHHDGRGQLWVDTDGWLTTGTVR